MTDTLIRLFLGLAMAIVGGQPAAARRWFDIPKLERRIRAAAARDLHFPLQALTCPIYIAVKKGNTVYCQGIGTDGERVRVRVRVTDDRGHALMAVPG